MKTLYRALVVVTLLVLAGCKSGSADPKGEPDTTPEKGTLTLTLPAHYEYLDRKPPRVTRLTIDGEDFTRPPAKDRKTVRVDPRPGKDSIQIVFSFWPVPYSNTIRTRVVKMKPGEELTVDLTKEDPTQPDRFEAIFFQTPDSLLHEMMTLAAVKSDDTVMDIGCGDGRLVTTAVKKFQAKKGIGIDIREELIELCDRNAKKEGVTDRTEFKVQDALKLKDLSHVSVVFLYLGEDLSAKLQPLLQKTLKPGARVVSLDFPIGDWKSDATKKVTATNNYGRSQEFTLHLWKVK